MLESLGVKCARFYPLNQFLSAMRKFGALFAWCFLQFLSQLAFGAHWDVVQSVCRRDLDTVAAGIRNIRLPIGCELVNCCPVCRMSSPIELVVRLSGQNSDGVRLNFEGLSEDAFRKLKIIGARKSGSTITLAAGEARISGFPSDTAIQILPEAILINKITGEQKLGYSLTFEQRIDGIRVNFSRFQFPLKACISGATSTGDKIDVQYSADLFIKAVVDYRDGISNCVNDATPPAAAIQLGKGSIFLGANAISPDGACPSSSITILSEGNALHYQRVTTEWTLSNQDTVQIPLRAKIRVPLNMWVVAHSGTSDPVGWAEDLVQRVNSTFDGKWQWLMGSGTNYGGVVFDPSIQIPQRTDNIGQSCTDQAVDATMGSGFYELGQINVYVIDAPGVTSVYCREKNIIILDPNDEHVFALEHEIGHAMLLSHSNSCLEMPGSNAMNADAASNGPDFTVGQAMRMHISSESALNKNPDPADSSKHLREGDVETCLVDDNICPVPDRLCPAVSLDP